MSSADSSAAWTITVATRPYASAQSAASSAVQAAPRKCCKRREQRSPDGRVVLGDTAEPPVVPAELLQERHDLVELRGVADHGAECADQLVPLGCHRDREHLPDLGMGQEQV